MGTDSCPTAGDVQVDAVPYEEYEGHKPVASGVDTIITAGKEQRKVKTINSYLEDSTISPNFVPVKRINKILTFHTNGHE